MPITQKVANSRTAIKRSGTSSTQATVEEIRRSAEVFLRAFQSARQLQAQNVANGARQNGFAGKQSVRGTKGGFEPREEIAREIIGKLQSYINALHQSVAKSSGKTASKLNGASRSKAVAAKSSSTPAQKSQNGAAKTVKAQSGGKSPAKSAKSTGRTSKSTPAKAQSNGAAASTKVAKTVSTSSAKPASVRRASSQTRAARPSAAVAARKTGSSKSSQARQAQGRK